MTVGTFPQIHISLKKKNNRSKVGRRNVKYPRGKTVCLGIVLSCELYGDVSVSFIQAFVMNALDRSWQHSFEYPAPAPRGAGLGYTGNLHSYACKKGAGPSGREGFGAARPAPFSGVAESEQVPVSHRVGREPLGSALLF